MSAGMPRPLEPADAERAALTAARAFAWYEPWGAWALPDESTRERRLVEMIERDIRSRFLPLGRASTIDGVSVSLWCPPASDLLSADFGPRRDEGGYAAFGDQGDALRASDALLASLTPEGDYWYLDTLATDPEHMGHGLGGRLLDHDLAELDVIGATTALDTHTAENVAFYGRRGFEVVGSGQIPYDGPDLYVMVRPPSRPAD
jgi:ribosomal protein S18 acetylase RimI-like enzyme